ncbi:hypothetical protein Scep_030167 [Stephania cephalantha]|uniref:Uncharacterized protein n=1 Tax=Stephania cephalantha TaxID=152367 RepID=A0AAP0DZ82_9MAGN
MAEPPRRPPWPPLRPPDNQQSKCLTSTPVSALPLSSSPLSPCSPPPPLCFSSSPLDPIACV